MACGGGTSGSGLNVYEGQVVLNDGKSIAGAVITIESSGDSTTSKANGKFRLFSGASGDQVVLLAETATLTKRVSLRNIFEEHSRVRVQIVMDQRPTDRAPQHFNVRTYMAGLCDAYFENRETIRQSNRFPFGTVCTIAT
jgi:hypothetical protein